MSAPLRLAFVLLPLLAVAGAHAQDDDGDTVTIYRCTDATDRLTVSDSPCPKGQRQQAREMLRPKDAPPRPVVIRPVQRAPEPPPRVVVINTPRPLYECVRPDGSVYESDDGDGDPRWVPLWTLGYPAYPGHGFRGGGVSVRRGPDGPPVGDISASRSSGISAPPSSSISIPPARERARPSPMPPPRPHPPGHGIGYGYGAGTWVRDACHALPQGEVCDRLVDRRDALRTRFFNAQQRERDILRVEERSLNARLANDCGVD